MKTFSILFFITLATLNCPAQTLTMDKVPPVVSRAFKAKFPDGSQPGWSKAGVDVYVVSFFNGKKRQGAQFNGSGQWLRTDSEIHFGKLPMKVQQAFMRQFENYNIQEVYEVQLSGGDVNYEIIAFKAQESFIVTYSSKGGLLSKEAGHASE